MQETQQSPPKFDRATAKILVALLVFGIAVAWASGHFLNRQQKVLTGQAATEAQDKVQIDPNQTTVVTRSEVPGELSKLIYDTTAHDVPGCVINGEIVGDDNAAVDQDVVMDKRGFAATAIGCSGSSVYLFAKKDSKWVQVANTPDDFKCSDLNKYNVPLAFLKQVYISSDINVIKCRPDTLGADSTEVYHN